MSQLTQVAATAELWEGTERAAANAASMSLNMSHSATVRLPQLLCITAHNMTNVTLSLSVKKQKDSVSSQKLPYEF